MDEEVINDVISALVNEGTFTESEINEISEKLTQPDENFEQLRLQFTLAFLSHPDMLKTHSYSVIIEKAKAFTQEYVKRNTY